MQCIGKTELERADGVFSNSQMWDIFFFFWPVRRARRERVLPDTMDDDEMMMMMTVAFFPLGIHMKIDMDRRIKGIYYTFFAF